MKNIHVSVGFSNHNQVEIKIQCIYMFDLLMETKRPLLLVL